MQETHSMGGGRFFGGGVGDRRLRPHGHHHQNHQALKCPRCDSLNTKFCYYNNYNLSQPRHFCKNCRRYWTKGGVLRNVPVGGGCRKSKRSNKPKNNSSSFSSETTAATAMTSTISQPSEPERKSNSHSSSESSSLTAAAAAAPEAVSAPTSKSDSNNNNYLLDNVQESKLLIHQNGLEQGAGDCGLFSEIGSFTSLITSANEAVAFGFGNSTSPFRFTTQQGSDPLLSSGGGAQCEWQQQNQKVMGMVGDHHHQDLKLPEITAGSLLDQTVPVDLSALHNNINKTSHGGFGSLDWHGVADQGLFDLSNTVDQAYWTHTHWSDQDNPTLFHLP